MRFWRLDRKAVLKRTWALTPICLDISLDIFLHLEDWSCHPKSQTHAESTAISDIQRFNFKHISQVSTFTTQDPQQVFVAQVRDTQASRGLLDLYLKKQRDVTKKPQIMSWNALCCGSSRNWPAKVTLIEVLVFRRNSMVWWQGYVAYWFWAKSMISLLTATWWHRWLFWKNTQAQSYLHSLATALTSTKISR